MIPEPTAAPPPAPLDIEFRPLDPRVIKLWRLHQVIWSAVIVGMATVAVVVCGFATNHWLWPVIAWHVVLILRLVLLIWYPTRAYRSWGYRIDGKVLETRSGIWFRIQQMLPLSRLQHVDLHSGLIERSYGLASLTFHTAGTQFASIVIPGLDATEAARLRNELVAIGGDDGV